MTELVDKFTDVMGADAEEDTEAKAYDLALWERKAIHDFKARGRVYRPFESDVIDDAEYDRISTALRVADSIGAIKAIFRDEWEAPEVTEIKAIEPAPPIVIMNQPPAAVPPPDMSEITHALADMRATLTELAQRPEPTARTVIKDVTLNEDGRIIQVIEREQYDG